MKHPNHISRNGKPAAYKRAGVHIHNKSGQPGWRLRAYDPRTDR
jgi:hypothetical protein